MNEIFKMFSFVYVFFSFSLAYKALQLILEKDKEENFAWYQLLCCFKNIEQNVKRNEKEERNFSHDYFE